MAWITREDTFNEEAKASGFLSGDICRGVDLHRRVEMRSRTTTHIEIDNEIKEKTLKILYVQDYCSRFSYFLDANSTGELAVKWQLNTLATSELRGEHEKILSVSGLCKQTAVNWKMPRGYMDVDGMEIVETVVIKIETGAVVAMVVVVVDVCVGEVTASEHADERIVAGNLASAPGVEAAATPLFTMAADSVGSKWLG